MSIEATPRPAVPVQAHMPPASRAAAGSAAPKPVAAPIAPQEQSGDQLAKPQLYYSEKVDLGFRTEEVRKNLREAISRLNEQMKSNGRNLTFGMDEEINRTVITVKNKETGEVVRQIPTETVLRMAHSIEDMKGLLFNEVL